MKISKIIAGFSAAALAATMAMSASASLLTFEFDNTGKDAEAGAASGADATKKSFWKKIGIDSNAYTCDLTGITEAGINAITKVEATWTTNTTFFNGGIGGNVLDTGDGTEGWAQSDAMTYNCNPEEEQTGLTWTWNITDSGEAHDNFKGLVGATVTDEKTGEDSFTGNLGVQAWWINYVATGDYVDETAAAPDKINVSLESVKAYAGDTLVVTYDANGTKVEAAYVKDGGSTGTESTNDTNSKADPTAATESKTDATSTPSPNNGGNNASTSTNNTTTGATAGLALAGIALAGAAVVASKRK